jgi:hypothetical protein
MKKIILGITIDMSQMSVVRFTCPAISATTESLVPNYYLPLAIHRGRVVKITTGETEVNADVRTMWENITKEPWPSGNYTWITITGSDMSERWLMPMLQS